MRTRRNIQGVIVLSTIESSEIAAPRRGSNPAPIHLALMVRLRRAEIFALPGAAPLRAPEF
jgi:hypothetical protein